MSNLSVVMYHYVRPLAGSLFPEIRGLELQGFREQLDYLDAQGYNFVSVEEVAAAIKGKHSLPNMPILLTFDDGILDHYLYVFPELKRRGVSGAFYPSVCAIKKRKVLDVQKIHYILASNVETSSIISFVEDRMSLERQRLALRTNDEYRREFMKGNQWDTAHVIYLKRLLQKALPEDFRARLVDELFSEFVSSNEGGFSDCIYMREEHLQVMRADGMHIGGHGATHRWLNSLTPSEQYFEVEETRKFLLEHGLANEECLSFCYPYGGFDGSTTAQLGACGFSLAFTTEVRLAQPHKDEPLQVPRIDTNHLPQRRNAECSPWTLKARA